MRKTTLLSLLAVLGATIVFAELATAESKTPAVYGTVHLKAPSGDMTPLEKAEVKLTLDGKDVKDVKKVYSNEKGQYIVFGPLPNNDYRLTVKFGKLLEKWPKVVKYRGEKLRVNLTIDQR